MSATRSYLLTRRRTISQPLPLKKAHGFRMQVRGFAKHARGFKARISDPAIRGSLRTEVETLWARLREILDDLDGQQA